tara:strand:- start:660 stop:899 length:240 start_codon:yes stop_codon:yes gene_type:complete
MNQKVKDLKEWGPVMIPIFLCIIAFLLTDKNQTLKANTAAVHELTVTVALNTSTAKLNTGSLSDLEDRVRNLEKLALTN